VEIRREQEDHDPSSPGTALTIGAYDGVHTGHRKVIAEVRRLAADRGLISAVLTFDRHPASVVRPGSAPLLLTDTDQKLEQLASTGVDLTMVLPFDEERAVVSAEAFITEVLVGCMGVKLVVVGEDFHFGYQRLGNVAMLRDMGSDLGFEVIGLDLVGQDGKPARDHEQVSSTFIRRALARGDLERANAMLGRPYEVRGVVHTADAPDSGPDMVRVHVDAAILLPDCGPYACWMGDGTGRRTAVAALIGPLVGGPDPAECVITALPVDPDQCLPEGSVTLDFVSCLATSSADDAAGSSNLVLRGLVVAAADVLS
jgi:riboflavin kinase/FMN adenylyltransferase